MRRLFPSVLFNTDDPGAATPAAEPAPVAATPPAPQPPVPPTTNAPWSADIAQAFPDEAVRGQVDQFLRATVQPHLTRIEMESAPARELWRDLQGDESAETYIAVAEQLFGPEVAQAVATQLQGPATVETPVPTEQPAAPQLSAEDRAAIDFAAQQRAENAWQSEMNRVLASEHADHLKSYTDQQQRDAVFAPFVQASNGNFDQALAAFNQWHSVAVPAPAPEPTPEPPATLDGGAAPAAIPPTNPPKQSIDDALDSFLEERRAAAPPTVGQV